jgi:hypothetical protein
LNYLGAALAGVVDEHNDLVQALDIRGDVVGECIIATSVVSNLTRVGIVRRMSCAVWITVRVGIIEKTNIHASENINQVHQKLNTYIRANTLRPHIDTHTDTNSSRDLRNDR